MINGSLVSVVNTQLLMMLEVVVGPPQKIGVVPHGTRATAPITEGTFEGPRLRGKVLPGGGDWTLLRADGVLELDLRLTLATHDGALIHLTSFGLRHGPPDVIAALARGETVDPSLYYFRTAPRFETSAPQYAFLNRLLAISVGDRRPRGPTYSIFEILLKTARMSVGRRDLLKLAAAASIATAIDVPLSGCALSNKSSPAVAAPREVSMDTRLLMTVRIIAAPPQVLGVGPHGSRLTFPIIGGDFEGPRLRGRVVDGGDWGVVRSDGVLELSLRATLQTDDGALIGMTFDGMRHGPADVLAALGRGEAVDPAAYYFRTVPRFEAADGRYIFLNRIVAVGHGENRGAGALHTIYEVL